MHDFGESGGFPYLLMEFVDGANLREAMRAGRCTPEEAFAVIPEICAALQYAHDEGVLHRDIKPENLLLDTRGRVKIADFGIAKLIGEDQGLEARLTGSLMPGTPQYMAPEQLERTTAVDHRADIYSLGVVFYEMLTGELPIGRFAAPSEKTSVGGTVDDIVFRSLAKEPERRQQSAGAFKTQVEGAAGEPTPAKPTVKAPAARSRRPGKIAAGALLLAGAVVLFVASAFAVQFWQLQIPKKTAKLKQELKQELIAAKAEESKLRIRAVTAMKARVPEMERLRYIEAHNESLANISTLNEEHSARLADRKQSQQVSIHVSFLTLLAVGVTCSGMAIAGVVLLVLARKSWRAGASRKVSSGTPA